ncbi:unnamed protein product [Orchesella dallaii]|uniref:Uncharacterized protein n=1 Tax=Orchesella dallaii TaxID=48710 RepID=A0ABP1PMC7_9HEXA
MNYYSEFSIVNQNQTSQTQTSNQFPVTNFFGAEEGEYSWSMQYSSFQQTLSHPCHLNISMMMGSGSGHTSFHLVQDVGEEEDEGEAQSQVPLSEWMEMEVEQQRRGVADDVDSDGARKGDQAHPI